MTREKYRVSIQDGCRRLRNKAWGVRIAGFWVIIALLLHGCGHTGDTFYFAWNKALNKETLPAFRAIGILSIYDASLFVGSPTATGLFGMPDFMKPVAEVVRQADLGPEIGALFAQHVGSVLKAPVVQIVDSDGLFSKNQELDKSALVKRYDVDAVVVIETLSGIELQSVRLEKVPISFLSGKFIMKGELINLSNNETLWSKKHHYRDYPELVVWDFRKGRDPNIEDLKSGILPHVTSLVEWLVDDIKK